MAQKTQETIRVCTGTRQRWWLHLTMNMGIWEDHGLGDGTEGSCLGQDALGCVHAAHVLRACLLAAEDDGLALGLLGLSLLWGCKVQSSKVQSSGGRGAVIYNNVSGGFLKQILRRLLRPLVGFSVAAG
jgi:hypothetical protein